MRTQILTIIAALLLLSGCTSYPRYRTGGAEKPSKAEFKNIRFTTGKYVRLGLILQSYLGKPYAGSSKFDRGIDCSLFTRQVFRAYNRTDLPRSSRQQYEIGKEIPRRLIAYGDLVFFRTENNRISHVGISVGYDRFIHASTSRGVIISGLHEKYWSKRYAGAKRILP